VTDQASVDAAVERAGEIDVLVSNAGVIFRAAVEASPTAEIERLYAHNTVGAIRVTQALLPQMRERKKGRLLFVSSVGGRTVLPGNAAYAATKWALEAFAEWRSPTSVSTSAWPSRARSAPAPWTTCSPTGCPTTPVRRCLVTFRVT
jgi:NADP-dependent 3-hydroxy acid dehydrogenase YdfG